MPRLRGNGDDLGPAAFFLEAALNEVRRPDMLSVNGREP